MNSSVSAPAAAMMFPSPDPSRAVPPVIVGAGPAGIRAAQTLACYGLRPILLDEAARGGGQIYRQPPPGLGMSAAALYGFEAKRAQAVHHALETQLAAIDYRPNSLVWNAGPNWIDVLGTAPDGQTPSTVRLPWRELIVASGATDRILPLPGWTLPGVYSLGGAQVALKAQGCAIGRRVVFMGNGPLLYLVAYQYARAGRQHGVTVAAVLDTASFADKLAAVPGMLRQPATLAKGSYYVAWLRRHGVPVHMGVRPHSLSGDTRVAAAHWRNADGTTQTIACDAVALGHALRPETQLADLLDCRFAFDPLNRTHLPVRDGAGRSSVGGVYLAGDGAGIQGADAAEWAGERAALALLGDRGMAIDTQRADALERKLRRSLAFRQALERGFPFPVNWAAEAPDDLVICRCEEVTAGDLRAQVRDNGVREINRLKALCRVGMGRCQGRMCAAAAAEILAAASQQSIAEVGRLRAQAPIKPIPLVLHGTPDGTGTGEQAA